VTLAKSLSSLIALREADLEAFAGSEIAVVDEVIERSGV
jgi:hypothetical protein